MWGSSASLIGGVMVAMLLAGCRGTEGPSQYELSGTVTFQGKPVPAGTITFEPDAVKGNHGPQGFALIQDGRYDTRAEGRGSVGGPQVVRISGSDGVAAGEAFPTGKPLFEPYTTSVDLPKESSTHDFDVPVSAAR